MQAIQHITIEEIAIPITHTCHTAPHKSPLYMYSTLSVINIATVSVVQGYLPNTSQKIPNKFRPSMPRPCAQSPGSENVNKTGVLESTTFQHLRST